MSLNKIALICSYSISFTYNSHDNIKYNSYMSNISNIKIEINVVLTLVSFKHQLISLNFNE